MAAVMGEVYCFVATVNNDDGGNLDDIWTIRRWGYCGKEEKEGFAVALGARGRRRFDRLIGSDQDDI